MIEFIFFRLLDFSCRVLVCLVAIWFCFKVLSNPYNFENKGKKKGVPKNE